MKVLQKRKPHKESNVPSPSMCSLDISEGSISGGPRIVSGCGIFIKRKEKGREKSIKIGENTVSILHKN